MKKSGYFAPFLHYPLFFKRHRIQSPVSIFNAANKFMVKRYFLVILLLSGLNAVTGQDHCVDEEFFNVYNQYPKTINGISYEWNGAAWNVPEMKQVKVSSLDIGGNGMFKGLLEYKPASYSEPANSTKEYPVIIFFHGFASRGRGQPTSCVEYLRTGVAISPHIKVYQDA